MADAGLGEPRIRWLVPGKLGAVEVIAGTLYCQSMSFFRIARGKAIDIPKPDVAAGQSCWHSSVWLGTIGRVAYAINVDERIGERRRSIAAVAWTGQSWGMHCYVRELHSVRLVADGSFCGPGIDCAALRSVALQRAASAQAEAEEVGSNTGTRGAGDPVDFGKDGLPDAIPTFNSPLAGGYTTFSDQRLFYVTYRGVSIVGLVGPGTFGWRDYDGWLVGFWRNSQNGYEPLAGFQIARRLGRIRSINLEKP